MTMVAVPGLSEQECFEYATHLIRECELGKLPQDKYKCLRDKIKSALLSQQQEYVETPVGSTSENQKWFYNLPNGTKIRRRGTVTVCYIKIWQNEKWGQESNFNVVDLVTGEIKHWSWMFEG